MIVVACAATSPSPPLATTTLATTTAVPTTATTVPAFEPGDLAAYEPLRVDWGDTDLVVALADEESERQLGLMDVTDLGDFDGMLFAWSEPISTGFHMKNTLIALDLFFFDDEGMLVDQTTLQPCTAEPCPAFVADGLFRWVLEAPAGIIDSTGKLLFPEAD